MLLPMASSRPMVPTRDTGMVREGMRVARQSCKNKKVTATTRQKVISRVVMISLMAVRT